MKKVIEKSTNLNQCEIHKQSTYDLMIQMTMLWIKVCVLVLLYLCCCQGKNVVSKCSDPLGMEDGRIKNSQIRASSSYAYESVGPSAGRLNSEKGGGAWCPKNLITENMETLEFLEIDLEYNHVITAVVTQGRFANGQGAEFTEFYIVQFWREGMDNFIDYIDDDGKKILEANKNTFAAVETKLDSAIVASKIRIIPFSKHARTICLRIELKGCSLNIYDPQTKFDNKYGLEEGQIYVKIDDEGTIELMESQYMGVAVGVLVTVIILLIIIIGFILHKNYLSHNPPVISYNHHDMLKKDYNCEYDLDTDPDIVYGMGRNRTLPLTPTTSDENYTDSSLEHNSPSSLEYNSPLLNSHVRKESTRSRIQSGPSPRDAKNSDHLSPRNSNHSVHPSLLQPEANHSCHPSLSDQSILTIQRTISQGGIHGILKNGSVKDRQKSLPAVNWETFFPSPPPLEQPGYRGSHYAEPHIVHAAN